MLDQFTGLFVDPSNVPGYADAIIGLDNDREKMVRLARNILARVCGQFPVSA